MMNELRIELEHGKTAYAPGEAIAGTLIWAFSKPVRSVEARLFWRTQGKGSEDLEVVAVHAVEAPQSAGRSGFRFEGPNKPRSYSGVLVSIRWAIEAVVQPDGATALVEISIGARGTRPDAG